MSEVVYVLINESMPGLVKIGRTSSDLEQRIKQLDTTGVALPFQCFYAAEVEDSQFVEARLHAAFANVRVRNNREFFRITPHQVAAAVQLAEIKEITPKKDVLSETSDATAIQSAIANQERRSKLKFSALGIPPGSVLKLAKNSQIACTVIGDGMVSFEGEPLSPSAAALKALNKLGYMWTAVSGSEHWTYEDEVLSERRQRFEEMESDGVNS
jgi:hypothetical protein